MFKRDVKSLRELVMRNLRQQGLETPLLQRRIIEAWPSVAGEAAARLTVSASIRNQTLYVRLASPALRADLSMRRAWLTARLNEAVGSQVIVDTRFF